jgi:Glycosyl hydrolase family 47
MQRWLPSFPTSIWFAMVPKSESLAARKQRTSSDLMLVVTSLNFLASLHSIQGIFLSFCTQPSSGRRWHTGTRTSLVIGIGPPLLVGDHQVRSVNLSIAGSRTFVLSSSAFRYLYLIIVLATRENQNCKLPEGNHHLPLSYSTQLVLNRLKTRSDTHIPVIRNMPCRSTSSCRLQGGKSTSIYSLAFSLSLLIINIYSFNGWSVTLVDALDTMWMMELYDEFRDAIPIVANTSFTAREVRLIPDLSPITLKATIQVSICSLL